MVDDVTPLSTCTNQPTVYPLDTLKYLENADLGPPLAVVQVTPTKNAPTTQNASVTIDTAVKVAPVTAAPVTQVAAVTQVATSVTQHTPIAIDPAVQLTAAADTSVTQATPPTSQATNVVPVANVAPVAQVAPPTSGTATGRSRFLLCHKANRALSHPSRKASGFPRGNKTTRYTKYRRRQRLKAPHARPKGRQLQSQSHLRRLRLPRRHRRLLQSVSLPQRLLSLLGKLLSLPR